MSNSLGGCAQWLCASLAGFERRETWGFGEEPTRSSHQHGWQPLRGETLAEKVVLVLWPVIL
jgi:hypothetical protein